VIHMLIAPAAAFCAAFLGTGLMLWRRWHWAVDHPNDRSLHSDPTPRSGGLAIMAAVLGATALAAVSTDHLPLAALAIALVLAGVSLADDRAGLPISARLGAHLMAAGVFAAYLTDSSAPWWWMTGAILAITSMTNFFNFMDGANGLAGGMAVAGFGFYGVAAMASAPGLAMFCLVVAAAAAGFLCFNFGGRIFMGDGGSVPLGFLAAAIGIEGWTRGIWPIWFGPLAFAPFVVDATVTLLKRASRGERFWLAHREHYYQRLVRSGWSHRRLAVAEYSLMLACGTAALVARSGGTQVRAAAFATIGTLFLGAMVLVDRRWRRYLAAQSPSP
jgi:UDP-N-acetylmuramyl pentapeptide phosphotransferase/UDP-N-acetylglucosamine-1-phosphate transferase